MHKIPSPIYKIPLFPCFNLFQGLKPSFHALNPFRCTKNPSKALKTLLRSLKTLLRLQKSFSDCIDPCPIALALFRSLFIPLRRDIAIGGHSSVGPSIYIIPRYHFPNRDFAIAYRKGYMPCYMPPLLLPPCDIAISSEAISHCNPFIIAFPLFSIYTRNFSFLPLIKVLTQNLGLLQISSFFPFIAYLITIAISLSLVYKGPHP